MDKALTRGAFAKSLGISLSALDGYESDKRRISDKLRLKIREVYGVDLAGSTSPEAAEPPVEQPADEAAGVPVEEINDEVAGVPSEEAAEEAVDVPIEETSAEAANVQVEKTTKETLDSPAEEAVDTHVEESRDAHVEEAAEKTGDTLVAEAVDTHVEENKDAYFKEAAEEAADVPVVEGAEATADTPVEETAEVTVDSPAEETAEVAADSPAEGTTEETAGVPAGEAFGDAADVSAEDAAAAGVAEVISEVIAAEEEAARAAAEAEAARIAAEEEAAEEKAARKAARKAAKKQKADEEAARWVAEAINALSSITDAFDEDVVAAARSAYDSLTDDQEDLIPGDLISILIKAEQQIEDAAKTFPISDCWITVKDVPYTGKKIKRPSVKVELGETKLKEDVDYTFKYDKKARDIGMYALTVKGKDRFTGSVDVPFYVVPKAKMLYKLLEGDKQADQVWRCLNNIKGYQIEYSLKEDFSDSKKVKIKKSKAFAKAIGKLKPGKKYYARIRVYAKVDGKKYHSDWSKVKTIKT